MKMNRIIVEAVLAGKSQSQVAEQFGIRQPSVSQLMARWRHGGWPAFGALPTVIQTMWNFGYEFLNTIDTSCSKVFSDVVS